MTILMLNNNYIEMNYIPSMQIIATEYGAVVSDYWYACLNDDLFPDVAIGRFPVAMKKNWKL